MNINSIATKGINKQKNVKNATKKYLVKSLLLESHYEIYELIYSYEYGI